MVGRIPRRFGIARWVRGMAVAGAMIGAGPNASAQPVVDEAKQSFELGTKLYAEGAIQEALAAFEASYRASPRASSLQNVAQCRRDLRKFARAWEAYDELVRTFGPTLKPDKLEAAQRALDDLGKVTASLQVTIQEPGALVVVDDLELGRTPLGARRIAVGQHSIVATKPGFRTLRRTLDVKGGELVTLSGPFERELSTGHVVVQVTGDPAALLGVDGVAVGSQPWEGDLPVGTHRFDARGRQGLAQPVVVEVIAGQRAVVQLHLDAPPEVASGSPESPPRDGGTQRAIGWASIGVGSAGVVAGAITGGLALAKRADLVTECKTGTCYGSGPLSDLSTYHALGNGSTAGVVVGAALVGVGGILVGLAPRAHPTAPTVGLGPSSVAITWRLR